MLLVIHNLPSSTCYSDIKKLLEVNCGLKQLILDNLVNDGKCKKVTVGLVDDGDAAILVRKINGLYLGGYQLYVENVKQSNETEQPYRSSRETLIGGDNAFEQLSQSQEELFQQHAAFQENMQSQQIMQGQFFSGNQMADQMSMNAMMNYNMVPSVYMPQAGLPVPGMQAPGIAAQMVHSNEKSVPLKNNSSETWQSTTDEKKYVLKETAPENTLTSSKITEFKSIDKENVPETLSPQKRRLSNFLGFSDQQQVSSVAQQLPEIYETQNMSRNIRHPQKSPAFGVNTNRGNAMRDMNSSDSIRRSNRDDSYQGDRNRDNSNMGNIQRGGLNRGGPIRMEFKRNNNTRADSSRYSPTQEYFNSGDREDPNWRDMDDSNRRRARDNVPEEMFIRRANLEESNRSRFSDRDWERKRKREPSPRRDRSPPKHAGQKKSRWDDFDIPLKSHSPSSPAQQEPLRNPRQPFYLQNSYEASNSQSTWDQPSANRAESFSAFNRLGPKVKSSPGNNKRNLSQNTGSERERHQAERNPREGNNAWAVPQLYNEGQASGDTQSSYNRTFQSRHQSRQLPKENNGGFVPSSSAPGRDKNKVNDYKSSFSNDVPNKTKEFQRPNNKNFDVPEPKRNRMDINDARSKFTQQSGAGPQNIRPPRPQKVWNTPKPQLNASFRNPNSNFAFNQVRPNAPKPSMVKQNVRQSVPQKNTPQTYRPNQTQGTAEEQVKLMMKGQTWRDQAAAQIAKEVLRNMEVVGLDTKDDILKAIKSNIKSRMDVIIGDNLAIPMPQLLETYRNQYPASEDPVFFAAIIDKMKEDRINAESSKDETELKPKAEKKPAGDIVPVVAQPEVVPIILTAPKPKVLVVNKPTPGNVPNPGSEQKLPKYAIDKKASVDEKRQHRMEMEQDTPYDLDPVLQKALDQEVDTLVDLFMGECTPSEDDKRSENHVLETISDQVSDSFRKLMRLHITKRMLGIMTGVKMRVFYNKMPPKKLLNKFLQKYDVTAMQEAKRCKNMLVLSFNNYRDYDKLFDVHTTTLGGVPVSFKPLHLTGPYLSKASKKRHLKKKEKAARKMQGDQEGGVDVEEDEMEDEDEMKEKAEETDDEAEEMEDDVEFEDEGEGKVVKEEGTDNEECTIVEEETKPLVIEDNENNELNGDGDLENKTEVKELKNEALKAEDVDDKSLSNDQNDDDDKKDNAADDKDNIPPETINIDDVELEDDDLEDY